jgi:O-antigen/teichoic acid export membrane protein
MVGLRSLLGGTFLKNVFVVMSGTAIAQVIGFAFAPILSRLNGPEDFGAFGAYLSITMVFGAAATLNYSDTVLLPKHEEDAAPLFLVSCISSVGLAFLMVIFCLAASQRLLSWMGLSELGPYIWFVPGSVLLAGLTQALGSWCTRLKAFKNTSQAQVVRSVVLCGAQTGCGAAGLGAIGLIGAGVAADVAAVGFLGWAALVRSGEMIRSAWHRGRMLSQAREFGEFALYGTPQNLMNALSQGLPVLALSHYYGAAIAGYYAFGMRLLQVPMNFFLTSIRQVLFQQLSHRKAHGEDLYPPFLKATGGLILVSICPAALGFILAPAVFALVFGEQWRTAGEFGRWLIVWLAPAFCNVPANLALRILRKQRELFVFDVALLAARAATLILGGVWLKPSETIIILSMVGCVFNNLLIVYGGVAVWNNRSAKREEEEPISKLSQEPMN